MCWLHGLGVFGASMPRQHHALLVMCGDEPRYSMDPPDETPQFDRGGGSKRRRITYGDPFMDAISSSRTAHTPLARPTARELPPDEDKDWDESQQAGSAISIKLYQNASGQMWLQQIIYLRRREVRVFKLMSLCVPDNRASHIVALTN
jgi:hypothetical protein